MSESTTIGVKMAKANAADLDGAHELAAILDNLDRGYYPARDGDEDAPTYFDHEDVEHLQHLCDRLLEIARKSSLFRVAGGLATLLSDHNAVVDPAADCIELHPRLTAALADAERWRFWVAAAIEEDSARRAAIVAQPFPSDVEGFNAALDNAMEAFNRERAAGVASDG
jgi:hypothetical protein